MGVLFAWSAIFASCGLSHSAFLPRSSWSWRTPASGAPPSLYTLLPRPPDFETGSSKTISKQATSTTKNLTFHYRSVTFSKFWKCYGDVGGPTLWNWYYGSGEDDSIHWGL